MLKHVPHQDETIPVLTEPNSGDDVRDTISESEADISDMAVAVTAGILEPQEGAELAGELPHAGEQSNVADEGPDAVLVEPQEWAGMGEDPGDVSDSTLSAESLTEAEEGAPIGVQFTDSRDSSVIVEESLIESQEDAESGVDLVVAIETTPEADEGHIVSHEATEPVVESVDASNSVEPTDASIGADLAAAALVGLYEHAGSESQLTVASDSNAVAVAQLTVPEDAESEVQSIEDPIAAEAHPDASHTVNVATVQQAVTHGCAEVAVKPTDASDSIVAAHQVVQHEDVGSVHTSDGSIASAVDLPMPSEVANLEFESTDAAHSNAGATQELIVPPSSLNGADAHEGPDAWWAQYACALGLASGGFSSGPAVDVPVSVVESAGETQVPQVAAGVLPPQVPALRTKGRLPHREAGHSLGIFTRVEEKSVPVSAPHTPFPPITSLQQHASSTASSRRQPDKPSVDANSSAVKPATEIASYAEVSMQASVPAGSSVDDTCPCAATEYVPTDVTAATPSHNSEDIPAVEKRHARRYRSALPFSSPWAVSVTYRGFGL